MSKSFSSLPLTAFEEYMLRDDRATYPMSIVARLRFAGELNRKAAAVAWEQVLARHPLLRATVIDRGRRRPVWAAAPRLPVLQWGVDAANDRLPAMWSIDLAREAGLRGWASADSRHSALVLQVHHAACDGKAVLEVADDFLRAYARAVGGDRCSVDLSPCDGRLLLKRGTFGLTAPKLLKMLPAQLSGLVGAGKFLFRQPVPLLAGDGTQRRCEIRLGEVFPAVRTARLEAAELRRVSAAAVRQGSTVNDWLLRDFFLAVDDFRRRHESPRAKDWVRISVPINLRTLDDARGFSDKGDSPIFAGTKIETVPGTKIGTVPRMPAANVVSMVFLDRNARQAADPAGLLRGIHEEMELIRRRHLGLTFIWSLHALRTLPGGMKGRVGKPRCEATCVVSNIGRALVDSPLPTLGGRLAAGNVLLEGIDFFVPLREGTAASVALVFYAGELNICLQYDGRRITAEQADDLLATYVRMVRASPGADIAAAGDKAA